MANLKLKRFKCAGETYVVGGNTTITQAKRNLKRESKETLKIILEDKEHFGGISKMQQQRVTELRRIIRSC